MRQLTFSRPSTTRCTTPLHAIKCRFKSIESSARARTQDIDTDRKQPRDVDPADQQPGQRGVDSVGHHRGRNG